MLSSGSNKNVECRYTKNSDNTKNKIFISDYSTIFSTSTDKSSFRAFADIMNIPLNAAALPLPLATSTGTITPGQFGYGKTGDWVTDSSLTTF